MTGTGNAQSDGVVSISTRVSRRGCSGAVCWAFGAYDGVNLSGCGDGGVDSCDTAYVRLLSEGISNFIRNLLRSLVEWGLRQ